MPIGGGELVISIFEELMDFIDRYRIRALSAVENRSVDEVNKLAIQWSFY